MSKTRRWVIGILPTVIPAGQTVKIETKPDAFFRGEKLIVTLDDVHRTGIRKIIFKSWCRLLHFFSIAMLDSKPACYIAGLTVADKEQLPTRANPISSKTFFPHVLENEFKWDTCAPNEVICFDILNPGKTDQIFSASVFGLAAKDAAPEEAPRAS